MKTALDNSAISNTERRVGMDRRQWICHHDFPYVDSHGFLVENNRRKHLDRRQPEEKTNFKR